MESGSQVFTINMDIPIIYLSHVDMTTPVNRLFKAKAISPAPNDNVLVEVFERNLT